MLLATYSAHSIGLDVCGYCILNRKEPLVLVPQVRLVEGLGVALCIKKYKNS
jgi:hypothetical protein